METEVNRTIPVKDFKAGKSAAMLWFTTFMKSYCGSRGQTIEQYKIHFSATADNVHACAKLIDLSGVMSVKEQNDLNKKLKQPPLKNKIF